MELTSPRMNYRILEQSCAGLSLFLSLSYTNIFGEEFCSKPDKKSHGISDLQLNQLDSLHRLWEKKFRNKCNFNTIEKLNAQ